MWAILTTAPVTAWPDADLVIFDLEGGRLDAARLPALLHACPAPVACRVAAPDAALVEEALGNGVWGVMVPSVEDPQLAAACVELCGAGRLSLMQIETPRGLERAGEIARVPGLSGLVFGPNDYARSLGVEPDDPRVDAALDRVIAATAEGGVMAGTLATPATADELVRRGVRLLIRKA